VELSLQDGLIALALILAVATLLAIAPTLRVPYPILLVLGGLALALIPGMPEFELQPEVVFFGILPPLLYGAAFFTSLRELRANARSIGLLAIGLVIVTTGGVAVVAHEVVGLPWASSFVLGAIVSPTDPIAASAIARRLSVPPRLVTIVEGESLVNDGTGLVLYRVALTAVLAGTFSAPHALLLFVVVAGGGVALGLAVGWLVRQIRLRLDNPPAELTISLLTGYVAFIPAELMGVSSVLATVTAGVYLGWHTPELTTPQTRLQGLAVWEIVQYLLNALLFVLVGLQLPVVLDALQGNTSATTLVGYAVAVCAVVITVRFLWVFAVMDAPKRITGRPASWRGAVFVSWAGMRGAVSLAAALALPLTTDAGDPFPGRELILFLTFAVILATLVGMGLTLPAVISALGLHDGGVEERQDAKARVLAAEAALARLDELEVEEWVREDTAERVRGAYRFRANRFRARLDDGDDGAIESRSLDYQRLRRELLDAERSALVELRREGTISNEVWLRVSRDLDLEDARLDV
jgi:Na+/H+ antiporter